MSFSPCLRRDQSHADPGGGAGWQSARREAEDALLDQRNFFLEPDGYDAFLAILDAPPVPDTRLVALMRRKAPWES